MKNFVFNRKPERIVCLTEEPTEILYLLGEEKKIVGISAYTVRPKHAKEEKPVVSAFIGGNIKKIVELEADLIIGFSDIQADLAKELIKQNQQVLIFNQRSLQEILDTIGIIGNLVGREKETEKLVHSYINRLERAKEKSKKQKTYPKVYFEEWFDPMISGIKWVSELIELAGGKDIFSNYSAGKLAKDRIIQNEEILEKMPEIFIASWCGKPFDRNKVLQRKGWESLPAVKNNSIFEMDSSIILQPGPACLSDGLDALERIIRN